MATAPVIHVAVGVICRGDRVLIARRPDHVHQGGLLEFPGGKVEPGETVQAALIREIREETGLSLSAAELSPLIAIRHDYGDKTVLLDVWQAASCGGEPEGREGQQIKWRDPLELADQDFPAANRPILRALRLPSRYAITGEAAGPEDYLQRLQHGLPGSGLSLCLLRAPELKPRHYQELVSQAIRPADWNSGVQWMLHGAASLMMEFPQAAGLHLPWREAKLHSRRPIDAGHLLAVSCHSAEEIQHAINIGADFITLGPVKPTRSHPGKAALGSEDFRALVAWAPVVVYGLGGLDTGDEPEMREQGAQGFAGISYWWPGALPQQ